MTAPDEDGAQAKTQPALLESRRRYWNERGTSFTDPKAAVGYCVDGVPVGDDFIEAIVAEVRSKLDLNSTVRLLDVGGGAGLIRQRVEPEVAVYYLTDFSWSMLQRAGGARRAFVSEAGRLPLAGGVVDRVLCYSVFLEFPDLEYARMAIVELLRVTRAGGVILIGDLPFPPDRPRPAGAHRLHFDPGFFQSLALPDATVDLLEQVMPAKRRVNQRFDVRLRKLTG